MDYKQLRGKIISFVEQSWDEHIYFKKIYFDEEDFGRNEFLFFIKPEITEKSTKIKFSEVLDLIFTSIKEFNFKIHDVRILSSKYLADYNLIAAHYGVINKLSASPLKYLSKNAVEKFESNFNVDVNQVQILGSLEFLKMFPDVNPVALDYLNQNIKSEKIAPGTYIQKVNIDGQEIFLVNSFHPRQLKHFTDPGRSIITFTLSGDVDWSVARNDFIGKTNPLEAKKGSIRNNLLVNKVSLGLESVSSSRNGVHLSAGPIEALAEMMRYGSDFSKNEIKRLSDFPFGRKFLTQFQQGESEYYLNNSLVKFNGAEISVFDLTEECNSDEAIEKLKKAEKI